MVSPAWVHSPDWYTATSVTCQLQAEGTVSCSVGAGAAARTLPAAQLTAASREREGGVEPLPRAAHHADSCQQAASIAGLSLVGHIKLDVRAEAQPMGDAQVDTEPGEEPLESKLALWVVREGCSRLRA